MIYLQNFSTESGQGENVLLPGIIHVTDKNKVYYGNLKDDSAVSMSVNSNGEREFWDANGGAIVRNPEEITGNLIHFTLDGMTCTAIEGMTTFEWMSSKYNNGIYVQPEQGMPMWYRNGREPITNEIIYDGDAFTTTKPVAPPIPEPGQNW